MIIINSVVLIGRLSKDPELRFVPSTGIGVTKITLAVDKDLYGDKKKKAIGQGKPTADFIGVTIFGKQAQSAANYLSKGSMCAVHGRISTGSYTTQTGEKRNTFDIIADKIEFLSSKKENSSPSGPNPFDNFPDDDVFTPADDDDIPF